MQLPLNVSPVSASFVGLQRLGIHLVLSYACLLLTASLFSGCPLFSLFFSFSALGKIEVIILYSVGNVQSLLNARV